ncbi:MAG: hypothetical protein IJ876_05630 [Elusimicrobiaceae bacterium]|nr:hypothetical protein [Elusimicrobiaceae bacterium]
MNIRDIIAYISSQTDKQAKKELRQVIAENFKKLGIQNMASFAKGGRYDVKKTMLLDVDGQIRSIQAYDNKDGYEIIVTTPTSNKKQLGDYCMIPLDSFSYFHLLSVAIQLNDKLNKKMRLKNKK